MPEGMEVDKRMFTAMNGNLTLAERLKLAKHFNTRFELDKHDIITIDAALDQLRSNVIMRDDAESLYWERRLRRQRLRTLNLMLGFTFFNVLIVAILYGGMYWLM